MTIFVDRRSYTVTPDGRILTRAGTPTGYRLSRRAVTRLRKKGGA